MEGYLIEPWDKAELQKGINPDMWVPPEVDKLAKQVVAHYDLVIQAKKLITAKSDKGGAIWRIKTDKGFRGLKVLHRSPARSLFSVGAQDYITRQGGRVPKLNKTKKGDLYVEKGGKLWVVTDWIERLKPADKDLRGAQVLAYGLGEFHRYTQGYKPPSGVKRASRLYRWPAYYGKVIKKIDWFRNVAKAYEELPGSRNLISAAEVFEQQAKEALTFLEQSLYVPMTVKGEEHWGLAHQDYGWSNGQIGAGGVWVIDLDGVAYDLPIRDLRKLISSTMDDLGRWDATWLGGIIEAYHQANPLDRETYEILLNDLAFPNEFYKHINEMLYSPAEFLTQDLDGVIQHLDILEKTKWLTLAELKLNSKKFRAGSYSPKTDLDVESLEMKPMSGEAGVDNEQRYPLIVDPGQVPKGFSFAREASLLSLNGLVKAEDQQGKKPESNPENVNRKQKVLLICTEKLPVPPVRGGAIQTYIQGIAGILSQDHDVTILGTTDPSLPLEEARDGIRYVRITGEILEVYAQKVWRFLKDNQFELIHVFNRPRLVPLIREVAPQARIILSMHNDMFGPNKIHRSDALAAINEVERIITVSDYVGKTICGFYPQAKAKVRTIYSGVDLSLFVPWKSSSKAIRIRHRLRKKYGLEQKTVILFVGRLTSKKGVDLLVQALKGLKRNAADFALVIVGGTWYSVDKVTDYVAYVRALAEKAPFQVLTTGYVSADQIQEWFWAGDVFVCSSTWQEPLARVHYEAMAVGLPFITTARGGNPEVVIGQNGLIVEQPEDAAEFAGKLRILISDPQLRQEMGKLGRELAEAQFGWERVAQEVLEVWKQPALDYAIDGAAGVTPLEGDGILTGAEENKDRGEVGKKEQVKKGKQKKVKADRKGKERSKAREKDSKKRRYLTKERDQAKEGYKAEEGYGDRRGTEAGYSNSYIIRDPVKENVKNRNKYIENEKDLEQVLDFAFKAGSSVVRITRDKIMPMLHHYWSSR